MRLLLLCSVLLAATPAGAAEPSLPAVDPAPETTDVASFDHPLNVRLDIDLPIFFAASLPMAFFAAGAINPDPAGYLPSRAGLNPLDLAALDTLRPDVAQASDIAWVTMMTLPLIDHLIESAVESRARGKHFGRRFGSDVLVYGEAMAINALFTELIKFTAQRPRPLAYLDPADVLDGDLRADLERRQGLPDSSKSFLSGHTSASFTAAAVWSMLYTLKHPDRPAGLALLWGASFAGASSVAVLRVVAAKHHPTDVIAGAILGTAIGILTPLAHRRARKAPVAVVPMLGQDLKGAMVVGLLP